MLDTSKKKIEGYSISEFILTISLHGQKNYWKAIDMQSYLQYFLSLFFSFYKSN